jgi:hypothetical protein
VRVKITVVCVVVTFVRSKNKLRVEITHCMQKAQSACKNRTLRVKIRICVYKSHSCVLKSHFDHHTMLVLITLVYVKITLVRVLITFDFFGVIFQVFVQRSHGFFIPNICVKFKWEFLECSHQKEGQNFKCFVCNFYVLTNVTGLNR